MATEKLTGLGHDPYSADAAAEIAMSWRSSFVANILTKQVTGDCNSTRWKCVGGGDWAENRIVPMQLSFDSLATNTCEKSTGDQALAACARTSFRLLMLSTISSRSYERRRQIEANLLCI